jgi:hypothetical protein
MVICNFAIAEEAYTYNARGRRDPFIPLLRPVPLAPAEVIGKRVIETLADIKFIEDVTLQGIASDHAGKKSAIINDEIIGEGDVVGHLTIKHISRNEVTLLIGEKEYKLSIYNLEEGG